MPDVKSNVKLDVKIETRLLGNKIAKFSRQHGVKSWKIIKKGVEWFTQSVVKVTPPLGKPMRKRDVIELKTNRYSKKGKELKRYKVPYRTNRKKGAKYFNKKKDATAFAKIRYRFIGKYGWLAAGEDFLKRQIKSKLPKVAQKNKYLQAKAREIQRVKRRRFRLKPFVLLINKVKNISRYGDYATVQALRKTKNRLKGFSKKFKKEYVKEWR